MHYISVHLEAEGIPSQTTARHAEADFDISPDKWSVPFTCQDREAVFSIHLHAENPFGGRRSVLEPTVEVSK